MNLIFRRSKLPTINFGIFSTSIFLKIQLFLKIYRRQFHFRFKIITGGLF